MRDALSFLTVVGRSASSAPSSFMWFPVVGALVGLAVGGTWVGANHAWPASVAAALAVSVDGLLTGGLHLDGLADSGDGLLPPMARERRLDVMADPHVGAFGVIALVGTLLLRYAAFSAGPARVSIVAALWCVSRSTVALVALFGRYARPHGMATSFIGGPRKQALVVAALGLAISVPLALIDRGGHGACALAAELAVIGVVMWGANRHIGGYTGDVLGAQIVLGETAGLLVWAARW